MELETFTKYSYMSLCNKDEIDRIFNVASADDYLLKMRANETVEHVRIFRVFLSRMRTYVGDWCFNDYFDKKTFDYYINQLKEGDFVEANSLSYGFVFCNDPNGRILKTEFGNIITISESLKYFLYYMNLAFLDFDKVEVPEDVKLAAIRIAIRTMLQKEALDFDLDPRGVIPETVNDSLTYHTDKQLEFVIGHEFSHHFLGHLDDGNLIEGAMVPSLDSEESKHKFYSYLQRDELAADIDAIERPLYTSATREDILNRALIFFIYLDIYQDIKEQISPPSGGIKTHPDPMDRFYNLRSHFKGKVDFNDENLENFLLWRDEYKRGLKKDVEINYKTYDFYGSIYLGQWRGKVLIDRIDY